MSVTTPKYAQFLWAMQLNWLPASISIALAMADSEAEALEVFKEHFKRDQERFRGRWEDGKLWEVNPTYMSEGEVKDLTLALWSKASLAQMRNKVIWHGTGLV